MKKKLITLLLTVILVCFALVGCIDFDSDNGGIEIVDQFRAYTEKQGSLGYIVYVDGTLKNTSKKKYTYVSISFSVYDDYDNNVGTATDAMNYLAAGATWSYHAQTFEWYKKEPARVELIDITYM